MTGGGPGDEIRQLPMDPKVREAVAEIADSGNFGSRWIKPAVDAEVQATQAHADNRPVAEQQARKTGQYAGAYIAETIEANPEKFKTQIETIVASQGMKPEEVEKLLHDMAAGKKEYDNAHALGHLITTNSATAAEGRNLEHGAWEKLSATIQKGVDAAIEAPPATPNAPQGNASKQR